ncbi:flagellar assembly protein FliH [Candidatus Sodalis sp. SoCistrobi]|uniref:flagellar assembly protein FliH n=1 Tax=Candidatus Sodalis sp. SoCistrobi TaxID=1922216 RepID=UPI00093D12C2|nr:flagellar assembly protein FliH [Candidatus Sodalis sp. SoCistrobi]
MSDSHDAAWRPWSLTDFAPPPGARPAPANDTSEQHHQQLALARMREKVLQDAREAGFAQGQRQGFEQGQQEGFQTGLQAGLEEGRAQGLREQQPAIARWQNLAIEFQHSLDAMDTLIADRLAQLAMNAARQVLGALPAQWNDIMAAPIQHLLQQEPAFSGPLQLRVHPAMLPLVEQHLAETIEQLGWRLQADPQLHPGGCTLSAADGTLDASLATRWRALCRLAAPEVL